MKKRCAAALFDKSAERLLANLAAGKAQPESREPGYARAPDGDGAEVLIASDLAVRRPNGGLAITAAGLAHLARMTLARNDAVVEPFRGQHLALASRMINTPEGPARVMIDDAESPLAWLARRKGRDGRAMIEPHQLQAGERLRGEFTRARMMPRTTSNWESPVASGRRSGGNPATFAETVVGARQRIRNALDAVGPEFAGLLLDICCFLKGLEDIERERGWPARSGKVVLQLALDRLARHYGLRFEARGSSRPQLQTWLAPDAAFTSEWSGDP
jgi:hypothetical protein